jgi:hypothetical protein
MSWLSAADDGVGSPDQCSYFHFVQIFGAVIHGCASEGYLSLKDKIMKNRCKPQQSLRI